MSHRDLRGDGTWKDKWEKCRMPKGKRKELIIPKREKQYFNLVWWAPIQTTKIYNRGKRSNRTHGDEIKDNKQPKQQKTTNTTRYEGQVPTNGHAYTAVGFGFSLSSISVFFYLLLFPFFFRQLLGFLVVFVLIWAIQPNHVIFYLALDLFWENRKKYSPSHLFLIS